MDGGSFPLEIVPMKKGNFLLTEAFPFTGKAWETVPCAPHSTLQLPETRAER